MTKKPILLAILAAVCYGISFPFSKLLLEDISPVLMASMLYIGAGSGMVVVYLATKGRSGGKEARITRRELPYTVAMVGLDIAAPILLMLGLSLTTSATAALLNNFEIVATAVVAIVVFKEAVGKRMWVAIALITVASVLLSVEDFSSLSLSIGSVFVLLACACWGVENNCTRMLSLKNPVEIVAIKGVGAGLGSLIIAAFLGELSAGMWTIVFSLALGFVSYGLSIYFYVLAQRGLGAARTSAYYAAAPFMGVFLSFVIFGTSLTFVFVIALLIMFLGACLAAFERHSHKHTHVETTHEHRHNHSDSHHSHAHPSPDEGEHSRGQRRESSRDQGRDQSRESSRGQSWEHSREHSPEQGREHSHEHTHEPLEHSHEHTPDLHHTHDH